MKYYIHTAHFNYEEHRWEWFADHPYHTSLINAERQMEYLQKIYPYKKYCIFQEHYFGLPL